MATDKDPLTRTELLSIVQPLLECPTAPMFEAAVRTEIQNQLQQIAIANVERDAFGNLIVSCADARQARYAFVAHMDHPGWQLRPNRRFLGGVPHDLQEKGLVRAFGDFGMWDLPSWRLDGNRLQSRACDDLIGCATIIAILQTLERRSSVLPFLGIFTRAEEVGFIGAIQLAKSKLLPPDTTVVSLETSAERPPAKMGDGPIIRVGDRVSVFDAPATEYFVEIAQKHQIRFQRCLMAGGTCEATVFQVYGYRSAALCIALGNYHNCTPDSRIDAEYIDLEDLEGLIALCVAIAGETEDIAATREAFRKRLEGRLEDFPLT
jgi:putative aminopeptidase FrvX